MKKLINLIALVMLVSVNVLTPFTYADVEDFDSISEDNVEDSVELGEIPENNEIIVPENNEVTPETGEVISENNEINPEDSEINPEDGEVISENNEINPEDSEINPEEGEIIPENKEIIPENNVEISTDEGDDILEGTGRDENSKAVEDVEDSLVEKEDEDQIEENEDEVLLLKQVEQPTTMDVVPGSEVTLLPGKDFNEVIKKLVSGRYCSYDNFIDIEFEVIQRTGSLPIGVTTTLTLSVRNSNYPVYARYDSGIIYYTTQAETIYMNSDSSYMFYAMEGLKKVNIANLDASKVTNIRQMFGYCLKLSSIDIGNWHVNNVTNMSDVFQNCHNLTEIDINNWNTSNVTNMERMFYGCINLETIYVGTGFVVNNVTTHGYMFGDDEKLVGGNGTKFDGSKINKTYAKIDKAGQKGYFTDYSGDIKVNFVVYPDIYETQMAQYGQKVNRPINNPIKSGSEFKGWVASNSEEYNFDTQITKYTEIYAQFSGINDATLAEGGEFNKIIKKLSGQGTDTYNTSNTGIVQILPRTGAMPSGIITSVISAPYSNNEIVAWYDSGIIYYYTDAEKIYLNQNSSYMFYYLQGLIGLDTSNWDTSNVTDMKYLFFQCTSLTGLDLSNWNTSSVTNMTYMFEGCKNLEMIDLTNWNTAKVTNMQRMFNGCYNLKDIYASPGFVTTKVSSANSKNMFYNNAKLIGGNGTKYNSSDKTYAKIDSQTQSGYFTDKTEITVKFMVGTEGYQSQVVQYGQKVIKPSNPGKGGTEFKKWVNENSEEYNFNTQITRYTEIYATFDTNEAILISGKEFNVILKKLSGQTNPGYSTNNTTITQIVQWTGNDVPSGVTIELISVPYSDNRVVAWYDSGTIYYYSEAETIYMNPDSSYMFNYMQGLTEFDLTSLDASNVTNMESMFNYCNNLTELDLSSWDTSNVTDMRSMFIYCNSLQELNLSGWNFSKNTGGSPLKDASSLKKINMTNAKFSGSMSSFFYNLSRLKEIIGLEDWDVGNVTDMSNMFYNCSSLTGLDLSNRDVGNVTDMGYMFYNCNNLETIYASAGFVITGVTSSSSMFYNDTKLIGGNGTMYSGGKTDKTYAKIDNQAQSGYFTEHGGNIKVNFMVGQDVYQTKTVQYGGKVAKPTNNPEKEGVEFKGWTTKEGRMYDFDNAIVDRYTEIYAVFNTSGTTLLPGGTFSSIIKTLADGVPQRSIDGNSTIREIVQWTGNTIPEGVITRVVSVPLDNPILVWFDSGTIYYFTEADKIYLNSDSSYTFYMLRNLTKADITNWDASNVTGMRYMFHACTSLTQLDLSSWDTSNVTDMRRMFYGCYVEEIDLSGWDFRKAINKMHIYNLGLFSEKLKKINMTNAKFSGSLEYAFEYGDNVEEINLSGADVSGITNMRSAFTRHKNLIYLNLNGWDTSNVTDMRYMFDSCYNLTGLDLSSFDTSNVTSMDEMFYNCSGLINLNLSNFDTKNVTSMYDMFRGCSNLTGLDLSSWNTSNVTSMNSMFSNCSSLVNLNLSGWDFRRASSASLVNNIGLQYGVPLRKLNMTNVKFAGSMNSAFWGMADMEELILDGVDTSNVTDMGSMFIYCSSLTGLDLSSFDTSKVTNMNGMFNYCTGLTKLDISSFDTSNVTNMGYMFYDTPNLKTIYASDKFVRNALTGYGASGTNMFYNSVSIIGGNGTKFDSGYTDKTYALIDKVGQTGYFTDKNAITVKFINTLDGTETTSTFAKGQKLTPPFVDKYHVVGGYLDEAMTQEIDLKKGVDSYSEIYVKYERNGSSGGGGGGGGGSSTKPDTPKEDEKPSETPKDQTSSGTTVKEPETTTGNKAEIETGSQVDSSEQVPQNDTQDINNSPAKASEGQSYSTEFQQAYEFAKGNGITTMPTIQKAQMNTPLTRIAMAKMLSQYAVNVLGKEPDLSKGVVKFNDVTNKMDKDYDDGVTLAYQLGIMGQNMPGNKFRPNDEVTRAEFATALSRLLYSTSDGKYQSTSKYYEPHMQKLKQEGIITNTDPKMKELRGYVMIMLMRSAR